MKKILNAVGVAAAIVVSLAVFTETRAQDTYTLNFTSPKGGEIYRIGSYVPVKWIHQGLGGYPIAVELENVDTLKVTTLGNNEYFLGSTGNYNFPIPKDIEPGRYVAKLKTLSWPDVKAKSNIFKISQEEGSLDSCPRVTGESSTYYLNPCNINLEMTDGEGDLYFSSTVIQEGQNKGYWGNSYGLSGDFPYGSVQVSSFGSSRGNARLSPYFSDALLSSDGDKPRTYSGRIRFNVESEVSNQPLDLYLNLNLKVNPSRISQKPTPIGSVPVSVKSSDVVLKVNSNQLTMLYSHGANEDVLAGVVNFSINGGKNGINIYEYPGISVIDSKGVRVSPQSTQSSLSAVGNVQKIKDDQGRSLFVVPAGKTVFFESKIAMSPLEMFSGIYYASLEYLYGNTNTDMGNAVNISIPKNKSNTVTVVGEKSPYIASVTNPVNVGEKLSINGVRLLNKKFASVYIDGVINTAANSTLDGSKDGTVLWFVVPSLKNGYHTLFVKDSINGQSNRVSFEVGGGMVTPEITSVVPSKGPVGTKVTVKGTQLKSKVNNLVSLCSQNSCGNYTGYTSEDGGKVSFTVPNIPSGVYNLSIIDLVENNSSTNSLPFTVIQSTPTSTPPVTAATSSLVVAMKSSDSGNITSNKGDTILLATVSFDSKNNPVLLQSFNFDVVVSGGKSAGDIFSNIMVASPAGKTQLTPSLHMSYDNMNLLVQPGKSNVAYITATLNSGIPNGTKAYLRINSNMENVKAIDSKSNPVPVEPIKMLSSGIITLTSPVVNTSTILNALRSVFGL